MPGLVSPKPVLPPRAKLVFEREEASAPKSPVKAKRGKGRA